MKKIIATASVTGLVLLSFAASAGYWDFKVYNYLDDNGQVVGTYYKPCFNRQGKIVGQSTRNKVLVEVGTCR